MNAIRIVVCVAALGVAGEALAQDVPLVTDRPDFTESSEVVGPQRLQFESGFAYERSAGRGSVTAPSSLARIGMGRRVELRVGTDGYFSEGEGLTRVNGIADMEVGVKVRLFDAARAGVDIAVIPMVSLPTGSDEVSAGHADPTVKFTWARDLPAGFGLSGNYNLSSLSSEDGRFGQQALSASLGHDLALGFGSYLEIFGFTPMAPGSGAGWTIDGGVSHQIGRNLQFDVETGRGVTAEAPDWFLGFGVAIRGRFGRQ